MFDQTKQFATISCLMCLLDVSYQKIGAIFQAGEWVGCYSFLYKVYLEFKLIAIYVFHFSRVSADNVAFSVTFNGTRAFYCG